MSDTIHGCWTTGADRVCEDGTKGCSRRHPPRDLPPYAEHFGGDYVDPYQAGAAVAFGLMGMAEAIRAKRLRLHAPDHEWDAPLGSDFIG